MNKNSRKKFSAAFTLVIAAALGLGALNFNARAGTELGSDMKAMGKNLKQLKGQIADATKQQSTVDLLESAKKNADAAKKLTPSKAKDVPEADRAKFVTDYQAAIDKLIGQLGKIEDAVKAGKYDDAQKLFGEIGMIKREGHEKFAPKD
jgi:soluble cytochrome b562